MNEIQKPSVQSLLLQMRFNQTVLSVGTGFLAESKIGPVLITNRHNVTGRRQDDNKPLSSTGGVPNEIAIHHNSMNGLGNWVLKVEKLYLDDDCLEKRWVEHPTLGARADFVALPLTATDGISIYPYDLEGLEQKIRISPAEIVSVIGFPFGKTAGGLFPVWATGFTASEPSIDYNDLPVQLIDCRSRQGQSGSPVLAYRAGGAVSMENGGSSVFSGPVSRLVGIYSGRINAESDLGIVWKTYAISELVKSIK